MTYGHGHGLAGMRTDSFYLPYPYGRTYAIMQTNHGAYSHDSPGSRYTLDFTLAVGDTICAADAGVVVARVEGYRYGGGNRKWDGFDNFITLYHPAHNVYTQYVHLQHAGSLVELGEHLRAGQPIGLAGATGWTSKEHLHFVVAKFTSAGRESLPFSFGRRTVRTSESYRKGERVRNGIRPAE